MSSNNTPVVMVARSVRDWRGNSMVGAAGGGGSVLFTGRRLGGGALCPRASKRGFISHPLIT
jgi:hypothetical protein